MHTKLRAEDHSSIQESINQSIDDGMATHLPGSRGLITSYTFVISCESFSSTRLHVYIHYTITILCRGVMEFQNQHPVYLAPIRIRINKKDNFRLKQECNLKNQTKRKKGNDGNTKQELNPCMK